MSEAPRECPKCTVAYAVDAYSYGLAGGGLGPYAWCDQCGGITWKRVEPEEDVVAEPERLALNLYTDGVDWLWATSYEDLKLHWEAYHEQRWEEWEPKTPIDTIFRVMGEDETLRIHFPDGLWEDWSTPLGVDQVGPDLGYPAYEGPVSAWRASAQPGFCSSTEY